MTILNTTAKQIADEIITISQRYDEKMERWSDVSMRPDNLDSTECVGFITKETDDTTSLSLTIDLQAPASKPEALLRVWAIKASTDESGSERFNNIQLSFTTDYASARHITEKGATVTRDDLREVLHEETTQLAGVTVSNQSGFDTTSQQSLGKRYDLTSDELMDQDDIAKQVSDTLRTVVSTLR